MNAAFETVYKLYRWDGVGVVLCEAKPPWIHWWESRQEKYPQLFQLFLKFAFIPATSSMVESEFSYSGLVITDRRNRIKPENVNDIMIARNSCAEILKTRKKI